MIQTKKAIVLTKSDKSTALFISLVTRLCCLCFSLIINYSDVIAQTSYPAGEYWVQNFKKTDGLPEDIVIDITQDHKGYIWLTTPHKLVQYDGYAFKIFNPNDQFPDLYVHFYPGLVEDGNGILWMVNLRNGLFSFNPVTQIFTKHTVQDSSNSLSNNNVLSLTKDKANVIWATTENGLNKINSIGNKVSFQSFGKNDPELTSKFIDTLLAQNTSLVNLTKIGNDALKSTWFEIADSTFVFINCLGESINTIADYGYILNMKGDTIWKVNVENTISAGGAAKNGLQLDILKLPLGKYNVFYKTDDSHAWNNWNDKPPIRPNWWGIQVVQLPLANVTKTMNRLAEINSSRGHSNYIIQTILHDSYNNMWAVAANGLEKIMISPGFPGKYSTQKIVLPANFYPGKYILELDMDRLIMQGIIMNSRDSSYSLGSVIYNHKANTFEVNPEGINTYVTNNAKCFLRDKNHNYWMGSFETNEGLYVSDTGTDMPAFKKLDLTPPKNKTAESTGNEQIWTLFEDASGYIWAGSRQNGLYKIKSQKSLLQFIPIKGMDNGTANSRYDQIAEDVNGLIWLHATNNVITSYNRMTKKIDYFPPRAGQKSTILLVKDTSGNIVLSDGQKTRRYDPKKSNFTKISLPVPDSLRLASMDVNGNYWAVNVNASSFSTLFAVFNGQYFQFTPLDSTYSQIGMRNIHIGKNGNVWVCPSFNGVELYSLNNQTKTTTFKKRFLPEGFDVFDIYEDEDGMVWVGTYDNGLLKLNPEENTYTSFTIKNGMPSNFIQKIIPLQNRLWIITDLGSAFLTIDNESIRKSKELDEYLIEYTKGAFPNVAYDQGFIDNIIHTNSGEIALVAENGFCIFDPDDFGIDTIKPVLQISTFTVNGHSFNLERIMDSTNLVFPHFHNDIEIEYIGLQYNRPDQNQYKYFLKGSNKEWILAGTDRIARYSNLPPGHYEFFLRSANADGIWSDEQKMFSMTINPPWWRTWWAYSLYGIILAILLWRFYIFQKLRTLRIERERTQQRELAQAKEIEKAYTELGTAHENLKATQKQLIQSEKMASLGELTAGIAHEIQNPLNFVNNFSELNTELIDELNSELASGNLQMANEIASNIKENEEKINFHGKRADAIVKGMLQHSRSSSGVKEPTDINALADEYLRLAYHGLRAKDKSFNATMKTDFDPNIGLVNVIPQDIGRVILNLITNAFYAISSSPPRPPKGGETFVPTVTIKTRKLLPPLGGKGGQSVEVSVTDNGPGIPQHILDKIFQPFFTTKPTGQGTGLGLSLSYDIVKAHGGELKVETTEGEGSVFIIQLPIANP